MEIYSGDSDTMSTLDSLNSPEENDDVYISGEISVKDVIKTEASSKGRKMLNVKTNTSEIVKMKKTTKDHSWNRNSIQVIPPYEEESTWIIYNGYPYYLKYTSPQGSRYQCSRLECEVKLYVRDCADGVDTVDISHEHDHTPDTWVIQRNQFYQSLKSRVVAEPTVPCKVIYCEEAERFPDGAEHIPFSESTMQIWRNEEPSGSFDQTSEDEFVDEAAVEWLEDFEEECSDKEGEPPQEIPQRMIENGFQQGMIKTEEEYTDTEYLEISEDEVLPPAPEVKKRKTKRTIKSNKKRKVQDSEEGEEKEEKRRRNRKSIKSTKAKINVTNTAKNISTDKKIGSGHKRDLQPIAPYRRSSTWVMYKRYPFFLRERKACGISYKCSYKDCNVRLYMRNRTGVIDQHRRHNHRPESWIPQRNMLYQELRRRSFSELTHLKTIYKEEIVRFPEGAKHLPYLDTSMRMWRKQAMDALGIAEKTRADLRFKATGHESEVRPIAPYRIGSTYVVYMDYPYYLRNKKPAGLSFKCTRDNCGALIYIRKRTGAVDEFKQHDHPPDSWVEERNMLYQALRRRSFTELTNVKTIYKEEIVRYPEGAKHLSFLDSSMRMWRKKAMMDLGIQETKPDLRIKASGHESELQPIAPYRIGSTYVLYKDYPYYLGGKKPAGSSYKCTKEDCRARLYVRNKTGAVDEYRQHEHSPESWVVERNEMYQELKRRAISESTSFKDIFAEEAARFPEGAKHLSNLESSMRSWRKNSKMVPSNPKFEGNSFGKGMADTTTKKAGIEIKATGNDSSSAVVMESSIIHFAYSVYRKHGSDDGMNICRSDVQPIEPYHIGSSYVVYKDYPYFLQEETPAGSSYKCSNESCGASIYLCNSTRDVDEYHHHDHPPELWVIERNDMYQELKRRVNSEMTPIDDIYKEEAARFPQGAKHLPNVRSSMRTWRKNCKMEPLGLFECEGDSIDQNVAENTTDKADVRIKAAGHESEVQLIAPYRIGSTYVMYRDYPYYLRDRKPAGTSYKCSNENCGAGIYVRNSTGAVDEYKQHDHPPESWVIPRNEMYQELKRRAISELTPFKDILKEEAARFPEGAKYLPNLESTMRNWRKKNKMVPSSLWEYEGDSCVKVSSEGQTAVILLADNYERVAACCCTVVVDSSFLALPVVPQVQRMVVMHAIVGDRAYCPIIILFESESPALYDAAFAKIGLLTEFNPVINVYIGYDKPLNNALRVLFPCATFREHFYHYAQAVVRLASKCGLDFRSPTHRQTVQMLVALALLPRRHLKQGLLHIQHATRAAGELLAFFDAYRDAWVKTIILNKISGHEGPETSSNLIDKFQCQLLKKICAVHKSRPLNDWWQFINSVQLIQKNMKPHFKNYECWSETKGIQSELKKLLVTKRIIIPEFLQNVGQLLNLEFLFSEPDSLNKLNNDNPIANKWLSETAGSPSQNTVMRATSPDVPKSLLAKHGLIGTSLADSFAPADIEPKMESVEEEFLESSPEPEFQSGAAQSSGDATIAISVSPTGDISISNSVAHSVPTVKAAPSGCIPVKGIPALSDSPRLIPVVIKSLTPVRQSSRLVSKSGIRASRSSKVVQTKKFSSDLPEDMQGSEEICHACVVSIGQELCMVCGRTT